MSKRLSALPPSFIESDNLSDAWARLLLQIIEAPGKEIAPLVLSLTGFDKDGLVAEDKSFRTALEKTLKAKELLSVDDVAFTIFPRPLWRMAKGDRRRLFELYASAFPRYQAMNRTLNGRGLYFERLTMFDQGKRSNQLEWILSEYESRKGVRRSMLQAAIFDPRRDHIKSAQLGFPCLQHVSFEPTSVGLVTNAFYATQQVLDKAYGNYLGLCELGAFMADQMKMPLARLNVFIGIAKLDTVPKSDKALEPLVLAARKLLGTE